MCIFTDFLLPVDRLLYFGLVRDSVQASLCKKVVSVQSSKLMHRNQGRI